MLQQDCLFVGAPQEMMVEADLTELIDEDGRIRHRRRREQPRKQGGLAAPKEARYDRYRLLGRSSLPL